MPYVFDPELTERRTRKRRRLAPYENMARRQWEHGDAPVSPNEQECQQYVECAHAAERLSHEDTEIVTSSREELIECIKRGQRPTWVPKPGLEALCAEADAQACHRACEQRNDAALAAATSPEHLHTRQTPNINMDDHFNAVPSDPIERPRSALHAGDFRDQPLDSSIVFKSTFASRQSIDPFAGLFNATPPPWFSASPPPSFGRSVSDFRRTGNSSSDGMRRSRAPSLGSSLSSSFVMRIPTSPLVQATSSPSMDFSSHLSTTDAENSNPDKKSRRRTMPPNAFDALSMSPLDSPTPNFSRPFVHPHLRRESSLPHQSHQPRRSLHSFTYQPISNPRGPFDSRSRRPSGSSDLSSPRQHSSMVGSFEESILRGRMSTAPSKPLDFLAQIGVLGKGDCPASLKCPAHVSVPFPAVFYNYPASQGSRTIADDSPSPYVGAIDLETNLKPIEQHAKRRSEPRAHKESEFEHSPGMASDTVETALGEAEPRRRKKHRVAAKAPPGGAYRVPRQGQLQLIIKNPNKTAVKLFLIPYDLDGMEPGTKTFVRQRSFSSGPIIENVICDNPANLAAQDPLVEKNILRYLIHLKFCSTAKGRFYLYDSIRVVFANRVPDGKERLRNEIQLPDPRYSPYRPTTSRRSTVADAFALRRSANDNMHDVDLTTGIGMLREQRLATTPFMSAPVPFDLPASMGSREEVAKLAALPLRPLDRQIAHQHYVGDNASDAGQQQPPVAGFDIASTSTRASPIPWTSIGNSTNIRSFSPGPTEVGDGLLSRKLRELRHQAATNGRDQSEP